MSRFIASFQHIQTAHLQPQLLVGNEAESPLHSTDFWRLLQEHTHSQMSGIQLGWGKRKNFKTKTFQEWVRPIIPSQGRKEAGKSHSKEKMQPHYDLQTKGGNCTYTNIQRRTLPFLGSGEKECTRANQSPTNPTRYSKWMWKDGNHPTFTHKKKPQ